MKKIYLPGLVAFAILAFFNTQAQIYIPTGSPGTSQSSTKVGIGTDDPEGKLEVSGTESDLLLIRAKRIQQGVVGGPLDFDILEPDYAFRLSRENTSAVPGDPNPGTFSDMFTITAHGKTQIGNFPMDAPDMLSVNGHIGLYSASNNWMRFRFNAGVGPEMLWRAPAGAALGFKNDQTGLHSLWLNPDGKVGIGSNNFAGDHALHVNGNAVVDWLTVQEPSQWGDPEDYLQLKHEAGPEIKWRTSNESNLRFHADGSDVMYLSPEGKLGIKTDNFLGDHSLYVAGSMIMEEGFVKLKANWPDYVFAPGYALMPLYEVGEYIQNNGRLPGMPSAAQVAEEGVAVGETQRLLTEKVEELTLYLLQMSSRLRSMTSFEEELNSRLRSMTDQYDTVMEEMEALREEITTLKGEK